MLGARPPWAAAAAAAFAEAATVTAAVFKLCCFGLRAWYLKFEVVAREKSARWVQ